MAQTPALLYSDDSAIDYTPGSAVTGGDVVVQGNVVGIAAVDIAANALGSLTVEGIFKVPKITGAITAGAPVYWNTTADPVTGTAGTGAAQATPTGGTLMGYCATAAASGDSYVVTELLTGNGLAVTPRIKSATVAAAGSTQTDAASVTEGFTLVTAADDTKGVKLPAAAAGLICIVKSSVAAKILKIWPASGDKINDGSADASFSLASGKTVAMLVAYDATDWYTLPLLPS